jgi:hypothetical protein
MFAALIKSISRSLPNSGELYQITDLYPVKERACTAMRKAKNNYSPRLYEKYMLRDINPRAASHKVPAPPRLPDNAHCPAPPARAPVVVISH